MDSNSRANNLKKARMRRMIDSNNRQIQKKLLEGSIGLEGLFLRKQIIGFFCIKKSIDFKKLKFEQNQKLKKMELFPY